MTDGTPVWHIGQIVTPRQVAPGIWRRLRIEIASRLAERRTRKALAFQISIWGWLSVPFFTETRRYERMIAQHVHRTTRTLHDCEPS